MRKMDKRKIRQRKSGLIIAIGLAMLVAVMLSACSGGGNENNGEKQPSSSAPSSSAAPSESAQTEEVAEEPIKITWTGRYPPNNDDNLVQNYLEKKFNVEIVNIPLDPVNWKDQLNVKIASGEIPDVFTGDAWIDSMVQWADQGILAPIAEAEIRQYMPNYSAAMDQLDPGIWTAGVYKGQNYGIPKVWLEGQTAFLPAYNGNWLKAIGYDAPPTTLEELEDVLTKFTKNDPDGNGKADTYGMSTSSKDGGSQKFNVVFGAFGFNPDQWMVGTDGKLVFGTVSEQARQAFKLLNKWYKDGVIDPEFATDDWNRMNANFLDGRTGMVDSGLWYNLHESGNLGIGAKEKGFPLAIGKTFTGPDGNGGGLAFSVRQAPQMFGIQVASDEKKRIKLLQMMEAMATDKEVYMMTAYGEEGKDYDLVDGVPVSREADLPTRSANTGSGIWFNHFQTTTPAMYELVTAKEKVEFRKQVNEGVKPIWDPLNPIPLAANTTYGATLNQLEDEYFFKFILGQIDLDRGFDDFVAAWYKAGGQVLTDEANKIYAEVVKS